MSEKDQTTEKNAVIGGVLYLVATPIGNLSDITYRACKVLREVDFIAAEDTRNSAKLLHCLEISRPMVSYHQHNAKAQGERILQRLQAGESCALITDAGTPAISDPGEDLVRLCAQNGVTVTSIPGACASVTALTLSALSTRRFVFEGFLEGNANAHLQRLKELENETRTMLFHCAPHHLKTTLEEMQSVFGADRPITLCRELTKKNEEILYLTLESAIAHYQTHEPRGEYVLVVGGGEGKSQGDSFWAEMTLEAHFAYYLAQGLSKKDAVKAVARDRDLAKNEVYQAVMIKE